MIRLTKTQPNWYYFDMKQSFLTVKNTKKPFLINMLCCDPYSTLENESQPQHLIGNIDVRLGIALWKMKANRNHKVNDNILFV